MVPTRTRTLSYGKECPAIEVAERLEQCACVTAKLHGQLWRSIFKFQAWASCAPDHSAMWSPWFAMIYENWVSLFLCFLVPIKYVSGWQEVHSWQFNCPWSQVWSKTHNTCKLECVAVIQTSRRWDVSKFFSQVRFHNLYQFGMCHMLRIVWLMIFASRSRTAWCEPIAAATANLVNRRARFCLAVLWRMCAGESEMSSARPWCVAMKTLWKCFGLLESSQRHETRAQMWSILQMTCQSNTASAN